MAAAGLLMNTFLSDEFTPGLVSVIIPAFNRAGIIQKAIDSCFQQTYPQVEVIVVDDGSADTTVQTIAKLIVSVGGEKLKLIAQANAGPCVARNRGLKAAKGEFIQFLDSDDVLVADKLQRDVAEFNQDSELGMVYGKVVYVDENGDNMGKGVSGMPLSGAEIQHAIARNCWHTIGPLYRRSTCAKLGPWAEDLRGAEDLEYAARLKASGIPLKFSDRVVAFALADNSDKLSHQGDTPSFTRSQELFVDYTWQAVVKNNCSNPYVVRDLQMWLMNTAIKYALLKDANGFERCLGKAIKHGGRKVYFKVKITQMAATILGCRPTARLIRWLNQRNRNNGGN